MATTTLARFPFVDDLLLRPVTPARLQRRLDRASTPSTAGGSSTSSTAPCSARAEELHELNKIGVALSAERDINKLLELILAKSREITAADAGSLYLVERRKEDGDVRGRRAQRSS